MSDVVSLAGYCALDFVSQFENASRRTCAELVVWNKSNDSIPTREEVVYPRDQRVSEYVSNISYLLRAYSQHLPVTRLDFSSGIIYLSKGLTTIHASEISDRS